MLNCCLARKLIITNNQRFLVYSFFFISILVLSMLAAHNNVVFLIYIFLKVLCNTPKSPQDHKYYINFLKVQKCPNLFVEILLLFKTIWNYFEILLLFKSVWISLFEILLRFLLLFPGITTYHIYDYCCLLHFIGNNNIWSPCRIDNVTLYIHVPH